MKNRFFNPFVGSNYTKGILNKRVLVVGASFYCDQQACPYFKRCTDVERKDSSEFDSIWPIRHAEGLFTMSHPMPSAMDCQPISVLPPT
jgi:hypothetical protein